jgi:hypothetical protein
MYLVKALAAAPGPLALGEKNVAWAANEVRLVAEDAIGWYRANSAVFTELAGPSDVSAIAAAAAQTATAAAGTKNGSTVTATETAGVVNKTVLTCVATPISIADDAGVAQYGGVKVYDFPEGLIHVLGAKIDGAVTLGTTGTIINTWAGGIALGTVVATTGATLASTEANILAENDVAAATAKVAACDAVSTGASTHNGTATAVDAYLNLVVDDDATHTAGTGSFTGTITIHWINLGDNA